MGVAAILVMCPGFHDQGLDLAEIQLIQDVIVILVTTKNEEDLIKTEDAGVATTLKIEFSNIQGQLTPQSGSNLA